MIMTPEINSIRDSVRVPLAILVVLAALVLFQSRATAQPVDVTFLVVGKTSKYNQDSLGRLNVQQFNFFSEIFLTPNGTVTDAYVTIQGREDGTIPLERVFAPSPLVGDFMTNAGGYVAHQTEKEMDATFPDTSYVFNLKTPSGNVVDRVLAFDGSGTPEPITITLSQDNAKVSIDAIDPDQDVRVTWTDFSRGAADPNGILDDLIFIAVDDCNVEDMVHSGRPFEGRRFYTFRDSDFTVEADSLKPGQTYLLKVEHADLVETTLVDGVPGLATYATATFMQFRTTGKAATDACPGEVQ
jgi:hypothetical protein